MIQAELTEPELIDQLLAVAELLAMRAAGDIHRGKRTIVSVTTELAFNVPQAPFSYATGSENRLAIIRHILSRTQFRVTELEAIDREYALLEEAKRTQPPATKLLTTAEGYSPHESNTSYSPADPSDPSDHGINQEPTTNNQQPSETLGALVSLCDPSPSRPLRNLAPLREEMPSRQPRSVVVIYDHPPLYPNEYVALLADVTKDGLHFDPDPLMKYASLSTLEVELTGAGLRKLRNPPQFPSDLIVSIWSKPANTEDAPCSG